MPKIGPYEILDVLSSGTRPLYKVSAADGRVLALKAVAVAHLSPEMRERFIREGEICRTLDHPNLVRVYEAGEADGSLYQVMELLEGSDLRAVLSSTRQFTWPEKLSIMEQVCEGLEYAHARNLVHRDIKPANLFLENSGRVRVLDFGMVRVAESELTRVGSTVGTLNYMSPEQIRGERCTAASDVFSAGIVFFQLASGRHPFSARGRSIAEVVSAIVFESPPKLGDICPDAPEGLEFLLNKALEKDADQRTQNGGLLKQAVSLCRVTLEVGSASGPASSASEAPHATAVQTPDGEKTRLSPKFSSPPVSEDRDKTQIIHRGTFAVPPVVNRPPVPPPSAVPPPKPVPAPTPVSPATAAPASQPRYRYCPSCTFANSLSAPVCAGCGLPLPMSSANAPGEKTRSWNHVAIGIAVLLAIALVVVLIVKG